MKLKHTFIACLSILLMGSFSTQNAKGKLKTFYSSQNGDTMRYYYDEQGRLSYYTGAKGYKTSYEYKGNTIIETTDGGSRVTMFLNNKGLVDSLIDIDPKRSFQDGSPQRNIRPTREFPYGGIHILSYLYGGTPGENSYVISKKFVYDKEGFLRQETEYVNGKLWASGSTEVENGNIIGYTMKYFFYDTVSAVNPTNMQTETKIIKLSDRYFKYSYDIDKENSLAINGPYGKCSKNLAVRGLDKNILAAPNDSTVISHYYTFDKNGRVATLVKTEKSTDPPQWNEDAKMADICSFTYY